MAAGDLKQAFGVCLKRLEAKVGQRESSRGSGVYG